MAKKMPTKQELVAAAAAAPAPVTARDITLTDDQKTLARNEALATLNEYRADAQKLVEQVETKLTGLSAHMFALAKEALRVGQSPKGALAVFSKLCLEGEKALKEHIAKDYGGKEINLKEHLPCWTVFKSTLKGAFESGIDIGPLSNVKQVRKARDAIANAKREHAANVRAEQTPESKATADAFKKALIRLRDVSHGMSDSELAGLTVGLNRAIDQVLQSRTGGAASRKAA